MSTNSRLGLWIAAIPVILSGALFATWQLGSRPDNPSASVQISKTSTIAPELKPADEAVVVPESVTPPAPGIPPRRRASTDSANDVAAAQLDAESTELPLTGSESSQETQPVSLVLSDADEIATPEIDNADTIVVPDSPERTSSQEVTTSPVSEINPADEVVTTPYELTIDNPTTYAVSFLLNGEVQQIAAGSSRSFTQTSPIWIIRFHRGSTFGEATQELDPATYRFDVQSLSGWQLDAQ